MPDANTPARPIVPHTPAQREARKHLVLTHASPSATGSIAGAVIIKDADLFLVAQKNGDIPCSDLHGLGLYHRDCRFLDGYELSLGDTKPHPLVSTADRGYMAVFELTIDDIERAGNATIPAESIAIKWERVLDGATRSLRDRLTFINFGLAEVNLPVSLAFQAQFQDVFIVRGMISLPLGDVAAPKWDGDTLMLAYHGTDNVIRSTSIRCSPAPERVDDTAAQFIMKLQPRQRAELLVTLKVAASDEPGSADVADPEPSLDAIVAAHEQAQQEWLHRHTGIDAQGVALGELVSRSLRDLNTLRMKIADDEFFAAGLPWFGTLFGRDSIVTAYQVLAWDYTLAENTLRLLARYQGDRVDDWRDEQPGKLPHELRFGELANLDAIPQGRYYGEIDAPLLFLILLARHADWRGDIKLFDELRDNVDRVLEWIDTYADTNHDGYVDYQSTTRHPLINQGWKDSGDAIVNSDGTLAEAPIALAEVQGYTYRAKLMTARLFRRSGDSARADKLEKEAADLRLRFNRDYWMDDEGCFALALQAGGRQSTVVSSNAGQVLWSGIADPELARRTVARLQKDDIFSGWGVRTLATGEKRYNPIAYHLGTVWPHDNALIASGFRQYGFDAEANRIFNGIVNAAFTFEHMRLPELFAGFAKSEYGVPVPFPVADHPQAWSAGAVPYLLEVLLGLSPNAFEHELHVVRPMLPDFCNKLTLRRLRVGDARVDLQFDRTPDGIAVAVLHTEGNLEVIVEPAQHSA
jgi:glycogen debranching enzyme